VLCVAVLVGVMMTVVKVKVIVTNVHGPLRNKGVNGGKRGDENCNPCRVAFWQTDRVQLMCTFVPTACPTCCFWGTSVQTEARWTLTEQVDGAVAEHQKAIGILAFHFSPMAHLAQLLSI
jgi:hypothetical protein